MPGDTGHVDDHNDMSDVITAHDISISTTSAALTNHTGGADPHGDRAYADSTKAAIGHTHTFPVTSVNGKTGVVTLGSADVSAIPLSAEGTANGVATLDSSTLVPTAQIPNLSAAKITSGTLAIGVIPTGTTSTTVSLGNHTHTFPVTSVNTKTGVVVLVPGDIGAVAQNVAGVTSGPEYVPADYGMQAWTYDPARCSSTSTSLAAGVVSLMRFKLMSGVTLSKFFLHVGIAGTTIANCFAGLYDSTGARVAVTADQSSSWTSTGVKTINFSVNYTAAPGFYWIGLLVGSANIAPAFARGTPTANAGLVNINLAASSFRWATTGTGLTALPASFTPSALTASDASYWGAVG